VSNDERVEAIPHLVTPRYANLILRVCYWRRGLETKRRVPRGSSGPATQSAVRYPRRVADQRRGSIRAADAQSVTFVELFFDLVFVFAVTQLSVPTAHDLTPAGILRSILLGWLIWWAWTQFTWTPNPADTTHLGSLRRGSWAARGYRGDRSIE
jgi:low temperature requirement A protein (LtrA)